VCDCDDEIVALKMLRVLVAAGCSPFTAREPDGMTPALVARQRQFREITAYWLDQVGPIDIQEWTSIDTDRLLISAAENRVKDLRRAFEAPPIGRRLNCDISNERKETALLAAVARSATHSINSCSHEDVTSICKMHRETRACT
jgi:hypothetical protein